MTAPRLKWNGTDGKSVEYLLSRAETIVGRSDEVDLVLPSMHVSRTHAKIAMSTEGFEIEDLASKFGAFVNGLRIRRQPLSHGDRIVFGKGEEFEYCDGAMATAVEADGIVQKSLKDLGRVLPSEASDLEKILCVLDFQYQWNQMFTPESAATNTIEDLPSTSLVLGAVEHVAFESAPIQLEKGDVVLAYSDGLTEAENTEAEMFGEERVKEVLLREAASGAAALHTAIIAAIEVFTRGREQTDDITLVIAQQL